MTTEMSEIFYLLSTLFAEHNWFVIKKRFDENHDNLAKFPNFLGIDRNRVIRYKLFFVCKQIVCKFVNVTQ